MLDVALAECRFTLSSGGVFYACWPRNANARELRAAGAMLAPLTAWWADALDANAAGNAEYDSWFPVSTRGVREGGDA